MREESTLEACKELIRREAGDVLNTVDSLDEAFVGVAGLILACSGKVICSGAGTSGTVARRMAHLFNVTGTPALYQNPSDALHGSLGVVTKSDVVIAISKGGESDELCEFVKRSKARGAQIVVITAFEHSSLEGLSDYCCVLPYYSGDPENVLAMGSTLSNCAWGDALAMYVRAARNFAWDDILFLHPGGKVGKESANTLRRLHEESLPAGRGEELSGLS